MARKHADLVDEAIQALALDTKLNLNATEIWRRLEAGDTPLEKPHQMPKRTVQHKVATFRREASYHVDPLQDRDEADAASSAMRGLLRIALKEVDRFRERSRQAKLTAQDATDMQKWAKTVSEIHRHFAKAKTDSTRSRKAGESKGRKLTPSTSLALLADRMDQGQSEPASPHLPPPSAQLLGTPEEAEHSAQTKRDEETESDAVSDSVARSRLNGTGNNA